MSLFDFKQLLFDSGNIVHCGDSRGKKGQKRDETESFNDDANFKWLGFSGRGVGNGSETVQQCCTSI